MLSKSFAVVLLLEEFGVRGLLVGARCCALPTWLPCACAFLCSYVPLTSRAAQEAGARSAY